MVDCALNVIKMSSLLEVICKMSLCSNGECNDVDYYLSLSTIVRGTLKSRRPLAGKFCRKVESLPQHIFSTISDNTNRMFPGMSKCFSQPNIFRLFIWCICGLTHYYFSQTTAIEG
ncbi:hypothetical protein CDAR_225681 [Caerostris darwini]|uniref:Uncharacterized protein n=1 Tax=Caerostris darwini TaxID=1538125 RepID=A0AAV4QRD2_9ARAC|nr:hypothetical protein CDAR_225681 [Caerostris darwini]